MKLYTKALIGIGVGVVFGLLVPLYAGDTQRSLKSISDLVLNFSTWLLVPLLLVQIAMSTKEMQWEKLTLKFALRGLAIVFGLTILLTIIGGTSVLLLAPERIPILREEGLAPLEPSVLKFVEAILPQNVWSGLGQPGTALMATFFFGLLFGLAMHRQRESIRPLMDLGESSLRVLHQMNKTLVDVLLFASSVIAAYRLVLIREAQDLELFAQLLLLLLVLSLVLIVLVFPFSLWLIDRKIKPLTWLRNLFAPALLAFVSGSNQIPLTTLIRTGREDSHTNPRVWQWFYPLSTILARSGTAMITTIAFMVILRSYYSFEIKLFDFFFYGVLGTSILSFVLGSVPAVGLMASLAVLTGWYGQGLEEGLLILQSALPLLISFSVLMDVAAQVFAGSLLGIMTDRDQAGQQKRSETQFKDDFMIT